MVSVPTASAVTACGRSFVSSSRSTSKRADTYDPATSTPTATMYAMRSLSRSDIAAAFLGEITPAPLEACSVPVTCGLGRTARAEPVRTIPPKLDEPIRGVTSAGRGWCNSKLTRCGPSESAHARAGRGGAGYHVRRSYRVEFTRRSHVKMSWRSGVPPSSVCPQRFRSLRALGIAPPSLAHRLPLLRAPALQRGWLARRPKEETDTAESTPPGWVDLERAVEEIP